MSRTARRHSRATAGVGRANISSWPAGAARRRRPGTRRERFLRRPCHALLDQLALRLRRQRLQRLGVAEAIPQSLQRQVQQPSAILRRHSGLGRLGPQAPEAQLRVGAERALVLKLDRAGAAWQALRGTPGQAGKIAQRLGAALAAQALRQPMRPYRRRVRQRRWGGLGSGRQRRQQRARQQLQVAGASGRREHQAWRAGTPRPEKRMCLAPSSCRARLRHACRPLCGYRQERVRRHRLRQRIRMQPRHPDPVVAHDRIRQQRRDHHRHVLIGGPKGGASGELTQQPERFLPGEGTRAPVQRPEFLQQLVPTHDGLQAGAVLTRRPWPASRGERRAPALRPLARPGLGAAERARGLRQPRGELTRGARQGRRHEPQRSEELPQGQVERGALAQRKDQPGARLGSRALPVRREQPGGELLELGLRAREELERRQRVRDERL